MRDLDDWEPWMGEPPKEPEETPGIPNINAKIMRWFGLWLGERMPRWLNELGIADEFADIRDAAERFMVEWYTSAEEKSENCCVYLTWKATNTYLGSGYAQVEWGVDEKEVIKSLPAAVMALRAHFPRDRRPSPPIPIDIDAALRELANPTTRPPREERASWVLRERDGDKAADRFWEQRARVKRRMPRVCKTCGDTFTHAMPKPRVNSVGLSLRPP